MLSKSLNNQECKSDIECPSLGTLYTMQKAFQEILGNKYLPKDDVSLVAESLLGLVSEIGEVLQADQRWKKNGRNVKYDGENKVEEIADCFIFLLNTCIYSNILPNEICNEICKKIDKNAVRYINGVRPTLQYKNMYARIRFDTRHRCYYGKLLGIEEEVEFKSDTVDGIVDNFHNAVDRCLKRFETDMKVVR